jgi:tetratricopeptide (TPR) repeat protein
MGADGSAELHYLFRHQVVRDAMLQLLLPSERSRLHLHAMGSYGPIDDNLHIARALALHAEFALCDGHELTDAEVENVNRERLKHLRKWAELAEANWLPEDAAAAWQAVALHPQVTGLDAARAHYQAATAQFNAGRFSGVLRELDACHEEAAAFEPGPLHVQEQIVRTRFLIGTGKLESAEAAASAAVELAGWLNDPQLLAQSLDCRGSVLERMGRLEESVRLRERAVGLAEHDFPDESRANLLIGYGSILRELGRREEALNVARKTYDLAGRIESFRLSVSARVTLAVNLRANGESEKAEELYLQVIEMCRARGARRPYMRCLGNLANLVTALRGDYQRAEEMFIEAVRGHREDGATSSEAMTISNLASNWLTRGLFASAARGFAEATELCAKVSYPLLEARTACYHGVALALLGRYAEALTAVNHGIACLEGRDQGKFRLEFGELCMLQVRLAQPDCTEPSEAASESAAKARRIAESLDVDSYGQGALSKIESLEKELREAVAEGRAPRIIRGQLIESLTPQQCASLLDILGDASNPEAAGVWDALNEIAADETTPDWHDDNRANLFN